MISLQIKCYLAESLLDIAPHAEKFFHHFCSPWLVFMRILEIPKGISRILNPRHSYLELRLKDKQLIEISKKTFSFISLNSSFHSLLIRMSRKIDSIACKLGITQGVTLYIIDSESESMGCRHFSHSTIPLGVSVDLLQESDEVIDFVLAHELSHVAHNDLMKSYVFSFSILVIEVFSSLFFTPLTLPFIEGGATIVEGYLNRGNERLADRKAIQILDSNKGAIEFFNLMIQRNLRSRDQEVEKKPCVSLSLRFVRKIISPLNIPVKYSLVSPLGDFREDVYHPPFTERKRLAF